MPVDEALKAVLMPTKRPTAADLMELGEGDDDDDDDEVEWGEDDANDNEVEGDDGGEGVP
jgi:hypothetical protein